MTHGWYMGFKKRKTFLVCIKLREKMLPLFQWTFRHCCETYPYTCILNYIWMNCTIFIFCSCEFCILGYQIFGKGMQNLNAVKFYLNLPLNAHIFRNIFYYYLSYISCKSVNIIVLKYLKKTCVWELLITESGSFKSWNLYNKILNSFLLFRWVSRPSIYRVLSDPDGVN